MDMIRASNIDYLKLPPSSTGKHQANDRVSTFRDIKKNMKATSTSSYERKIFNTKLRENLRVVHNEIKLEHPDAMTAAYFEKVVNACEKFSFIMKNGILTPQKIIEGFVLCGQHVLGSNHLTGETTIDFQKIMSQTLAEDVTIAEEYRMYAMKDIVVAEALREGFVSNEFLDTLDIVKTTELDRDQLTALCRQDAQLLSHELNYDKLRANIARRNQLKDPIYIDLMRKLEAAKAILFKKRKADKALVAREKVRVQRAEEKAIEKSRYDLLTREEK